MGMSVSPPTGARKLSCE